MIYYEICLKTTLLNNVNCDEIDLGLNKLEEKGTFLDTFSLQIFRFGLTHKKLLHWYNHFNYITLLHLTIKCEDS